MKRLVHSRSLIRRWRGITKSPMSTKPIALRVVSDDILKMKALMFRLMLGAFIAMVFFSHHVNGLLGEKHVEILQLRDALEIKNAELSEWQFEVEFRDEQIKNLSSRLGQYAYTSKMLLRRIGKQRQRTEELRLKLSDTKISSVNPDVDPRPISKAIRKANKKYGIPEDVLLRIAKMESHYNCNAVSEKGAVGCMQVMPDIWAKECGLTAKQLKETENNILCGAYIVRHYFDQEKDLKKTLFRYYGAESNDYWQKYIADSGR